MQSGVLYTAYREYKGLKGLKKENLRDNMSTLELALNMLAEATTTELTKVHNPEGLTANKKVAKRGGAIAGEARKQIEEETGKPIITSNSAAQLNAAIVDMIDTSVSLSDNSGVEQS